MESSEDDDDFLTHEWITPQSSIHSIYQSDTEKGIRKVCSELLGLKDAVENLCGNMHAKHLSFLRISEEVIEMEQELIELQKHVSSQGILVKDLMSGVCRELEAWNKCNSEEPEEQDLNLPELNEMLHGEVDHTEVSFLEKMDILLAEHKVDEALMALVEEEKNASSYEEAFLERKAILVDQFVGICERPYVCIGDLKKSLSALVKLGKDAQAHQLLLKAYGSRLHGNIEAFLLSCSIHSETLSATVSQLVFSTISVVKKESGLLFGDVPTYTNRIVHWAECEIESFVRLTKEKTPLVETASALRSASICLQASLNHCSFLEPQGLKFFKLLMVLLRPHIEEVLDMNFRRAQRKIIDMERYDSTVLPSPRLSPQVSVAAQSNTMFISTGKKFMFMVKDILDQLTPMVILHFGGAILNKLLQLFDKYIEVLMKALPSTSEDETLMEPRESIDFRAETDAQQLALLGTAFTVADELLPMAVSKIFNPQRENKEMESGSSESIGPVAFSNTHSTVDYKDWKRHLQHSLDKLRDHFCRQYVLTFIYSREGKARLDARMYLEGKGDLFWDPNPLPSLPFQALFARLQQLASVAGDVLLGKEKTQKILLSRLTETVVMWLSEEQEFWDVFEDGSVELQPFGLQQLILDMHFIVEIAVCGGYSSRLTRSVIQQLVSAVITRAIGTFSARGVDPQSALPEDEWFVDTANAAINKLLLGTSGSESSEPDEHIIMHDEVFDSEETSSTPSTIESADSFASANMDDTESPVYFTDPET